MLQPNARRVGILLALCASLLINCGVAAYCDAPESSIDLTVVPPSQIDIKAEGDNTQFGAPLKTYFSRLDTQNSYFALETFPYAAGDFQNENLDLFARQWHQWKLHLVSQLPAPRANHLNIQSQELAALYMCYGDFERAEQALQIFLQTMDGCEYSDLASRVSTEYFWAQLDKSHPGKIAESIFDKAIACEQLKSPELVVTERREYFAQKLKEMKAERLKYLDKPELLEVVDREALSYEHLRQLFKAIASHDHASTAHKVDMLLKEYDKSGTDHSQTSNGTGKEAIASSKFKLAFYSALLHASRCLANAQEFELANEILTVLKTAVVKKENTPQALPFVLAELAFNQDLQSKAEIGTADLDAVFKAMQMPDLSNQQKLRWLGLIYSGAGYPTRALYFYNRALTMQSTDKTDGVTTDSIFLLLDAANTFAEQGNFVEANQLAYRAVDSAASPALKPNTPEWVTYNKAYRCKVATLVDTYIAQKHFTDANTLLAAVRHNLPLGATYYKPVQDTKWNMPDGTHYILDAAQAEVYAQMGQPALALSCSKRATQDYDRWWSNALERQYLVCAECAKATGDFTDAARSYSIIARETDHEPYRTGYLESGAAEQYLVQALECANLTNYKTNVDASQLRTGIIKDLACAMQRYSDDKHLELELAAYHSLPDSTADKQEIATKLAELALQRTYKSPSHRLPSIALNLALLKEAAVLAEKHDSYFCADAFKKLACEETSSGNLSEARAHFSHAIAKCTKSTLALCFDKPFISAWDVRRCDLTDSKRSTKSEIDREYKFGTEVLTAASKRLKEICPAGNAQASRQESEMIMFDLLHGQNDSAFKKLDEMLKQSLLPVYLADEQCHNGITALCYFVSQDRRTKPSIAAIVLQKILEEQLRDLPSNSFILSNTYTDLAYANLAAGRDEAGYGCYQKALAVIAPYNMPGGEEEIFQKLLQLAQNAHEQPEMKSRIQSWQKKLASAKVESLDAGSIDPESPKQPETEKVAINDDHRLLKGNIAQALTEYRARLKTDPYSRRSEELIDSLLFYHRDDKDSTFLKEVLRARIEIARRVFYTKQGSRPRQSTFVITPYANLLAIISKPQKDITAADILAKAKWWRRIEDTDTHYKRSTAAR